MDWIEGFDDNEDGDALNDSSIESNQILQPAAGNPLFYVNSDDANADGIPDWLEDDDNDGMVEASDTDGIPNFLDPTHNLLSRYGWRWLS